MAGVSLVVMENPSYSTLVLFKSPADAEKWRAACVDGTPEDEGLEGAIVETVEGLERMYGMLPDKVHYVIVNPPHRRDTRLEGGAELGEFLAEAREAARRHAE